MDRASELLAPMDKAGKVWPCKASYHFLIHSCVKVGNPKAASWCLGRMVEAGLKPNLVTYNSVIDSHARSGDVASANHWWDQLEQAGLTPNAITYNTMIKACAKARDPSQAQWWLHRMQQESIAPCIISFNTVIDAWARIGDVDKAEQAFQQMRHSGVEPDSMIYNTLINAAAKALQPDKAQNWVFEMRANNFQPDKRTYNCLLTAFAKVGDMQQAESWFAHMQVEGCAADGMIFGSLVHVCAKAGDVDRAEFWVEEMMRQGMKPNSFCLSLLMQACAQVDDLARASKWFMHALGSDEVSGMALGSILEAYARCGNLGLMEEWLCKTICAGFVPSDSIVASILRAMVGAGHDIASAKQFVYSAIVKGFTSKGDGESMRMWLCKMFSSGIVVSPLLLDDVAHRAESSGHRSLLPEVRKIAMTLGVTAGPARGQQPYLAPSSGRQAPQTPQNYPAQVQTQASIGGQYHTRAAPSTSPGGQMNYDEPLRRQAMLEKFSSNPAVRSSSASSEMTSVEQSPALAMAPRPSMWGEGVQVAGSAEEVNDMTTPPTQAEAALIEAVYTLYAAENKTTTAAPSAGIRTQRRRLPAHADRAGLLAAAILGGGAGPDSFDASAYAGLAPNGPFVVMRF